METMTPNVKQPLTPIAAGIDNAVSKGEGKSQLPAVQQPQQVDWQNLPKGIVYYRQGDEYKLQKGKFAGETRKRGQDMLALPTPAKLMEANPGMTEQEAETLIRNAGTAVKPGVMAEVSRASSDAAYIVRRYTNKVTDKAQDISVTLHRVNVESTVERLAREYEMTVEEVKSRLNIKETAIGA